MSAPRILIVADAGPEIGGGHVMRCLTLAQALRAKGAEVAFMASPPVAGILDLFAPPDIGRVAARDADPAILTQHAVEAAEGFDALVFDSFRLDAQAHRAIARGKPALVVDDLADRALDGKLIVEPDPGIEAMDYDGLIPSDARLMIGPDYAFVRPRFAELRHEALTRRAARAPVKRVLAAMGLTDVGGITARVVDRMLPRLGDAALDVVLGPDTASEARMQTLAARDPRVSVHVAVKDMAALMAQADLCVGAGGASVWERCTLGLPTVLVVLADNQAGVGKWLANHGAVDLADARAPDFDASFDRAFTGLMRSPDRVARLAAKSAELCDGLGAPRVAEAFLEIVARR
ncbi:MAG TPA: UDP-2,4-diacetamido-2,4,6-trideoxy-beta-L-altropyranose hydrolase [Caulobacteraceae bacterium]|jgi:UDP-2,4-diacetamido-2,4,6-trideoxy-beta-L-altropyranose hydrolase